VTHPDERDTGEVALPEEAVREFSTDAPAAKEPTEQPAREESPDARPGSLAYLEVRPGASAPHDYRFPSFERRRLANGMELVTADVPGRPLLTAQLLVRGDAGGGATSEPADLAGVTVLMSRALVEGTRHRDAVGVIEAAERLGAELSADAGWDSLGAGVEVPRTHLQPALKLLAEVALEPSFPDSEVGRLRDERVNDLMQARADPRRRSERLFPEQVYAADSPYSRPLGGTEVTVPRITRDAVAERHAAMVRPGATTLLVAGDLSGVDLDAAANELFVNWPTTDAAERTDPPATLLRGDAPRVLAVNRAGAPQTEVRIGHVGLSRTVPHFYAIAVMNAILGGVFNSRLSQLLREQRGYTYGIHTGFDFRRGAGPFAVRTAVQAEVTVPAVQDIFAELRRMAVDPPTDEELSLARDYLVGVFPLRFETAGQVGAALGGLVVFGLPDDELDRYRPSVAAVTADDVITAARAHVRPDEATIVLVGDVDVFLPALQAAGFGDVQVVRDQAASAGT
jgi:zinc protease